MSTYPHASYKPIPPSALLSLKEQAVLSVLQNERFLRHRGMTQQDIRHRIAWMPMKKFVAVFGDNLPTLGCIHRALKALRAYGFAVEISAGKWGVRRG